MLSVFVCTLLLTSVAYLPFSSSKTHLETSLQTLGSYTEFNFHMMNLVISQGSIQPHCNTEMSLWGTTNIPVILGHIRKEGILRIMFSI